MRYFPVFLDLKGRLCVVAGGGRVAERKVRALLKAGARVKVVSPQLTPSLARLHEKGQILHLPRSYRGGDLRGVFLAIAATDDRAANERVFRDAEERGIPVNVVDVPAHSSFIVPSVVEKKDLVVAISTSGKSPALARALRRKLEREIGEEYPRFLSLLGRVRGKVLALGLSQRRNQAIFRRLVGEDFPSLIKEEKFPEVDRRLARILGPGYSLRELGLKW